MLRIHGLGLGRRNVKERSVEHAQVLFEEMSAPEGNLESMFVDY
jgi:hypothetical protein